MPPDKGPPLGILQDIRTAWTRGRQVWKMVATRDKLALQGAGLVMAVVGFCATRYRTLLGKLVDSVQNSQTVSNTEFFRTTAYYLACIAGLFVLAEALQVLRKYVVQNTTTRIERDRIVSLVLHLITVDLADRGRERVGALHGRISRSVEGFVKFIKLAFQDLMPALFLAGFALGAVFVANWKVGLVMAGVLPAATF